jgi:acyl-CoA hydrolase
MPELAGLIRPGDRVIWGQGSAEPTVLTEALVAQREEIGPVSVFVGVNFAATLKPVHTDQIRVASYGAFGCARALSAVGALDIVPTHVSRLGAEIERGSIGCDVAMVQLGRVGPNGRRSLGAINDYMRTAIRKARVTLVEINEHAPWTYGPELSDLGRQGLTVESDRPLVKPERAIPTAVEHSIARHAASVIGDGTTLQVGIGSTVDAVLQCLSDRKDLGIHSGFIGDSVLELIEKGTITNARKPIDTGVTVTGALFGGDVLMKAADRNRAIEVHPFEYTHGAMSLAKIPNLVAINSAIEVDVTGQVNAEIGGQRYLGAVGGQVDFMHGSARSEHGFSMILIPSTASGGRVSRITTNVEVVTCARSEVDFVVTEFGAAELRGQTLRERMRRMIAIAHPDFRAQLDRDAFDRITRGY